MNPRQIQTGKVYSDLDGIGRYVISITPAEGRKAARVTWRRVGQFADKTVTDTITTFAADVAGECPHMRVDPAPKLPNNGMAANPAQ